MSGSATATCSRHPFSIGRNFFAAVLTGCDEYPFCTSVTLHFSFWHASPACCAQVDRRRGLISIVLELGETDLDRLMRQYKADVAFKRCQYELRFVGCAGRFDSRHHESCILGNNQLGRPL